MSANNNDNHGMAVFIGIIGAGFMFLFAFIFAAAAFFSLCMTLLCLLAWNKPRKFFGQILTPEEAREFVGRGLIGAVVLPVFVLFASVLFRVQVVHDFWIYFVLGGYTGGSLSLGFAGDDTDTPQELIKSQHTTSIGAAHPERTIDAEYEDVSSSPAQPFRFATWDDEEELRK
ncbi:hypothetical protein [Methylobacterium sp. 1030]|uniref:hypothetical protein n=1 Tax=Methylobacterium sp. 1030 TaxID=3156404 RepID=UPI0033970157